MIGILDDVVAGRPILEYGKKRLPESVLVYGTRFALHNAAEPLMQVNQILMQSTNQYVSEQCNKYFASRPNMAYTFVTTDGLDRMKAYYRDMKDGHPDARYFIARTLAEHGDPSGREFLAGVAGNTQTNVGRRLASATAVLRLEPQNLSMLAVAWEMLRHPDLDGTSRNLSQPVLRELGDKWPQDWINTLLQSKDQTQQLFGIQSLVRRGDAKALNTAMQMKKDAADKFTSDWINQLLTAHVNGQIPESLDQVDPKWNPDTRKFDLVPKR